MDKILQVVIIWIISVVSILYAEEEIEYKPSKNFERETAILRYMFGGYMEDPNELTKKENISFYVHILKEKGNLKIKIHPSDPYVGDNERIKDILIGSTISILNQIGDTRVIKYILPYLHYKSSPKGLAYPEIRIKALKTVGKLGGEKVADKIVTCLEDENIDICEEAIKQLEKIGDEKVIIHLEKFIKRLENKTDKDSKEAVEEAKEAIEKIKKRQKEIKK